MVLVLVTREYEWQEHGNTKLLRGIMANLKPLHAAAIARLAAYTPPATSYFSLPLSRRAAVLILLYADVQGELRVVLTMRAKTLSSYAGQAALPGGKADFLSETPMQTARREAWEEIGLPLSDQDIPSPFRVQQLCQLPTHLARTELGVRPCVAWIEADPAATVTKESGKGGRRSRSNWPQIPSVEDTLIPRLDAKEVAAVFTAPFESFLSSSAPSSRSSSGPASVSATGAASMTDDEWYTGQWFTHHGTQWRMHNFYVPSHDQRVAWAVAPPTTMTKNRFRVFGMTARILVDAARVAYGREPNFEVNRHLGDEAVIQRLVAEGKLPDKAPSKRSRRDGGGGKEQQEVMDDRDTAKM